jgi:MFS family permease
LKASSRGAGSGMTFLATDTAAWVVYAFVQSLPSILFPVFKQEFSLSYAELGLLVTVFVGAYALMEVPSGLLADRIGRKEVLVIGLLTSSLGTGATFAASTYLEILVLRAVSGLGLGMLFASSMTLLSEYFPDERRGKAIGVLGVGISGGFLAAPIAVGTLLSAFGWRAMFLAVGLLTIPLAVLLYFVVQEPETRRIGASSRQAFATIGEAVTRPILVLMGINALTGVAISGLGNFTTSYLVQVTTLGVSSASLLYSVFPVGGVVSTLFWGFATDKFDRWKLMFFGTLASAALLVALVASSAPSVLLPVLLARGLISNASGIALFAVFASFSQQRTMATSFALLDLFGNLGIAISPLLAGAVADSFGLTPVFVIIPCVVGGLALVLLLPVRGYMRLNAAARIQAARVPQ